MSLTLDPPLFVFCGIVAAAVWISRWRLVLCFKPEAIRVEADAPPDQMKLPAELASLDEQVRALGFRPIGSRSEKPPLGREQVTYDYAHPEEGAFASLYYRRNRARLYFLTRTDKGAFVISANYRRPAREIPERYFSAGLEHVPIDRIYKAHLKRVAAFGNPVGPYDQEGRLQAAREWFEGPGRWEVRLQNLQGLLLNLGMAGTIASVLAAAMSRR